MTLGSGNGTPVLRIWKYADAPADLRRQVPQLGTDAWVALVPADLMNESLLDLLQFNSNPAQPIQTLKLPDGDFLCIGLTAPAAKDAEIVLTTPAKTSTNPA